MLNTPLTVNVTAMSSDLPRVSGKVFVYSASFDLGAEVWANLVHAIKALSVS